MSTDPGMTGSVAMTVLGPVPIDELGVTLAHEHLLVRVPRFMESDDPEIRALQEAPVTLEHLGWIRQYWTYNYDNLVIDDADLAISEAARFKAAGGGTVVDVTLDEIGRDPGQLAHISRATGLHVVMGSGAYVAHAHPAWVRAADVDTIARRIIAEARDGVRDTGVRPGIIGEIGCTWPLDEVEARVLAAAAIAQRETGLTITVHPGRDPRAPAGIIDILEANGADLERVIIGHIERTVPSHQGLVSVIERGCSVAFDCFGLETSYYPVPGITDVVMPNDAQRLGWIEGLIETGHTDRVLVAHDICTKHRLARYGGHGFDHLPRNVRPWMAQRGVTSAALESIFVANPARLLAIAA